MKKRGKVICLSLIIAVLILGVIIFLNKKEINSTKQELYSTTLSKEQLNNINKKLKDNSSKTKQMILQKARKKERK